MSVGVIPLPGWLVEVGIAFNIIRGKVYFIDINGLSDVMENSSTTNL